MRNQTCRHISTDGWYITTCFFAKQTFAILEIYFRFRFRPFPEICTLFCIKLPNFVQIEAPTVEMWIWRHVHFSRWRPRRLNTTSGFVSVDVTAFRRSKFISKPNFVEISQMEAEIYFMAIQNGLGRGQIFFKIKNVSIPWDALLHFMNTKMYFWCFMTKFAQFYTKPLHCGRKSRFFIPLAFDSTPP